MRIGTLIFTLFIASLSYRCSTASKLQRQLADSGRVHRFRGVLVVDARSGKPLIDYNSNKYFTPASNTKLFSFYTALNTLGDSLPGLRYVILGDSLYFQGTANPAMGTDWDDDQTLSFLAAIQQPLVYVPQVFDQPVYGSGWAWDDTGQPYQRPMDALPLDENQDVQSFEPLPDSLVVARLSQALQKPVYLKVDFSFPPHPKLLYSTTADSVYQQLLQQSDNFVAEQLMLMVSHQLTGAY